MAPTLSLLVPTAGRPSLRRTIDSVAEQVLPGDELLVIGDTLDGPLPETEAICADYPFVRYIPFKGTQHDFGHSCINHGIDQARGDWIAANDDDDQWTSGALYAMREAIAQLPEPLPLLFRFRAKWGQVLWLEEHRLAGMVVEGAIGGHCLVCPANPREKVGRRIFPKTGQPRYQSDYDAIEATINNYGGRVAWCPAIIAVANPQ